VFNIATGDDNDGNTGNAVAEMDDGQRAMLKALEAAAEKGKDALQKALAMIPQDKREPFRPHLERLKAIALKAAP
jgi:hypothetical protein